MRKTNKKGWTRIPGPTGSTCGAEWHHVSGAKVYHCGHPTALRPYYGYTSWNEAVYNGTVAFCHLKAAQERVLEAQARRKE